jgi:hypothetical protein
MRVLIGIHGSHSQPEQMAAQRETWLANLQGADYKYFVGHPGAKAEDELAVDCADGPLWEGHQRTWILNRKTEAIAQYALQGGYDYVFKCDDDTYAFVDRLLSSGFEAHDYAGFMGVHHATEVGDYYWAQGGAGYWLSRRAMAVIVWQGLYRARAEDFAVGQTLAADGIKAHHDARYVPAATVDQLEHPSPDLITLHKVSAVWMRRIHASNSNN